MKRWSVKHSKDIESKKIDDFLIEIAAVCRKHGYSIGHEDGHGAFEIEDLNTGDIEWLMDAHISKYCSKI